MEKSGRKPISVREYSKKNCNRSVIATKKHKKHKIENK
jgi:hypothetical protein